MYLTMTSPTDFPLKLTFTSVIHHLPFSLIYKAGRTKVSFIFLNAKNKRSIITTIFASVVIAVFVAVAAAVVSGFDTSFFF
jgi:hypothetical protein